MHDSAVCFRLNGDQKIITIAIFDFSFCSNSANSNNACSVVRKNELIFLIGAGV